MGFRPSHKEVYAPFIPHFYEYIGKLGFTGENDFPYFFIQNIDCVPSINVLFRNIKNINPFSKQKIQVKKSLYIIRVCLRNVRTTPTVQPL